MVLVVSSETAQVGGEKKEVFYIKINVVGKNGNRPLEKEENRWKMRAM